LLTRFFGKQGICPLSREKFILLIYKIGWAARCAVRAKDTVTEAAVWDLKGGLHPGKKLNTIANEAIKGLRTKAEDAEQTFLYLL
jgi:hypothetical protein